MASDPALVVEVLITRLQKLQIDAPALSGNELRSATGTLLSFAHQVAAALPPATSAARRAILRQWLLSAEISLRDHDLPAALAAISQAAAACEAAMASCPGKPRSVRLAT